MTTVFVYGTLRQGMGNHHLLQNSKYLGQYRERIDFEMVDLGAFPGLVPYSGLFKSPITLEAYEVDDKTMEDLDRLEGYPSFYNRQVIRVKDIEGYIYYLNDKDRYNYKRVSNGDWLEYKYNYV